jgi:hypothetical protein
MQAKSDQSGSEMVGDFNSHLKKRQIHNQALRETTPRHAPRLPVSFPHGTAAQIAELP